MNCFSELKYFGRSGKLYLITRCEDKVIVDCENYRIIVEMSGGTPVRVVVFLRDLDLKVESENVETVKSFYEKILELRREGVHVSTKIQGT